jgi:hypothetical protein
MGAQRRRTGGQHGIGRASVECAVAGVRVVVRLIDRLLHHSYTLMVQGESYRLRQKKKAGLLGQSPRREA